MQIGSYARLHMYVYSNVYILRFTDNDIQRKIAKLYRYTAKICAIWRVMYSLTFVIIVTSSHKRVKFPLLHISSCISHRVVTY